MKFSAYNKGNSASHGKFVCVQANKKCLKSIFHTNWINNKIIGIHSLKGEQKVLNS